MKKIFWIAAVATGLIAAASCQKEPVNGPEVEGEEAVAVLTISIPEEIATKSYSDGKTATDLYYAVYDSQDQNKKFLFGIDQPLKFENGSLTKEVEIRLVKNYAYDIVFWAQAPGAPYIFDMAAQTITVDNYTTKANDENRDAFYQVVEGYKIVSTPTKVDLYRPFAQINFGASDYDEVTALGLTMASKVQISGLPNVLNVLDRTVDGAVNADFIETDVPAIYGEKLEVKGDKDTYGYVSMNYVLAPVAKGMLDNVTGRFYYNNDEVVIPVTNVPYQRNFRTNIIGEFFTGSAHFIVEIIPIYDKPDHIVVWPSVTVAYDSSKGFAAQLAEIGAGAEKNVVIDLGGQNVEWETGAAIGSTPLIGEDSAVERLTITNGTVTATGSGVGPVRAANGGTLVFENVKIVDQSVSYAENNWEYGYLEMAGNLEFRNVEFVNAVMIEGESAYFDSCTFNSNKEGEYDVWVSNGTASFVNCSFLGYRGLKMHEQYGSEVVSVKVDACSFGPLSKKPGIAIGTVNADTEVSITNSVFVNCQPGDQGLYIYETDTDVTTFNFTESGNSIYDAPAEGVKINADNTIELSTPEGLFWMAEQVNSVGDNFIGKTLKLTSDVDLADVLWTPVGQTGATEFKGVFDGQGHTIYNLNVDSSAETDGHYSSGLFGWLENHGSNRIVIRNLTVDGAKVTGHHNVAVIAGYAYATFENCHVANAELSCTAVNDDANGDKCGTIVGYLGQSASGINGCTASDCIISAGRDAGQIVGAAPLALVVDCSASNVAVNANGTSTGKNISQSVIGRIL